MGKGLKIATEQGVFRLNATKQQVLDDPRISAEAKATYLAMLEIASNQPVVHPTVEEHAEKVAAKKARPRLGKKFRSLLS